MVLAIETTTKSEQFERYIREALAKRAEHPVKYFTQDKLITILADWAQEWRLTTGSDLCCVQVDLASVLLDICALLEMSPDYILTPKEIAFVLQRIIRVKP
jgi:hypothetical protein